MDVALKLPGLLSGWESFENLDKILFLRRTLIHGITSVNQSFALLGCYKI